MQIEQEGISAVHCWKQTRERASSHERESELRREKPCSDM